MAKKSLIFKNLNILKNSKKNLYIIKKLKTNLKKKYSINDCFKLYKIKKKNFFVKFKNRCYISGRNKSFYNRFCLNRNFIRKIGYFGNILALEKSSW